MRLGQTIYVLLDEDDMLRRGHKGDHEGKTADDTTSGVKKIRYYTNMEKEEDIIQI